MKRLKTLDFSKLQEWYWGYSYELKNGAFFLTSFALYTAFCYLAGHMHIVILLVLLLILGGISIWGLTEEEKFLFAHEEEPDSLFKRKFFKTPSDWFADNELWCKYLDGELSWYQKTLFYLPFTTFLSFVLTISVFVGIFDNMRYEIKTHNLF